MSYMSYSFFFLYCNLALVILSRNPPSLMNSCSSRLIC
jgi:hypothetical protein